METMPDGHPGPVHAQQGALQVAEAVMRDILAGLSIVAVRGAPGAARQAALARVAARLRTGPMRVIILTASMADSPGAVAAALLQASGSNPGGKGAHGGAALSTGMEAAHPGSELDGLLAMLGMQELVFLIDDADSLSPGAYQLISLLLRLARSGTTKARFVLFGDDAPWPELRRVRQNLWATYRLPTQDMAVEDAPPPRRRGWQAAAWVVLGVAGLSAVVGYAGTDAFPDLRFPMGGRQQGIPPDSAQSGSAQSGSAQSGSAQSGSAQSGSGQSGSGQSGSVQSAPPGEPANPTGQTPDARPSLPEPSPAPVARPVPARGLLLVARNGDTLAKLYSRIYRGGAVPPFSEVLAMNPVPVRPGALVTFPEPPGGWPPDPMGYRQGGASR